MYGPRRPELSAAPARAAPFRRRADSTGPSQVRKRGAGSVRLEEPVLRSALTVPKFARQADSR